MSTPAPSAGAGAGPLPTTGGARVLLPFGVIVGLATGGLTAVAVSFALYIGLGIAAQNTRSLLEEQVEGILTAVEERLSSRLQPVAEQAQWVALTIESGAVALDDQPRLDAFMLGALAATPGVAGVAVIDENAYSRRWARHGPQYVAQDWSKRPGILAWIDQGQTETAPRWIEPFWTDTLDETVLLHQTPLRARGKYAGMFAQVLPLSKLSAELVELTQGLGLVPFVLYDGARVLAHPAVAAVGDARAGQAPMATLESFGDPVLQRIWTPDESQLFFLSNLTSARAVSAQVDGRNYGYLYRSLHRFGPRPWTIGVYLNFDEQEESSVEHLFYALAAGTTVLVVSVAVALWAGRRLSRPVTELAAVAARVGRGELDGVGVLGSSHVREIDQASGSINAMVKGLRERRTILDSLGRYVPEPVARELLSRGGELEAKTTLATVLFCDLEGFTRLTEVLGARGIVELLNEFFSAMVDIIEANGGMVTQFQGDALLATFNVPAANEQHAQAAVDAASRMQDTVRSRAFAGREISIRIGIATGDVVAGAVGARGRLSYTVHGNAVNLASRLEALNKSFKTSVLLSKSTASLVRGFQLTHVGEVEARGQSASVEVFSLRPGASEAAAPPPATDH